jgi:trans-2,3-dihydro-3-hydroxyanthranilate isomerase
MLQEPAVMGPQLDAAPALAAVGLAATDAAGTRLRPQVVSTGVPQVILPVQRAALARARANPAALKALLEPLGAVCLYVVAWESGGQAWARSFFVDVAGATEDPATGSAAGPVLAYLHERTGLRALDINQGIEMGRRSLLRCKFDDETERVRVGGDVVILAEGTVALPVATGQTSSVR